MEIKQHVETSYSFTEEKGKRKISYIKTIHEKEENYYKKLKS